MYLDYFGFDSKPFNITPDPRFVFLSTNHKDALAHLIYGIRQRSGFIELSGEVGAGKTTLLRTLLRDLSTEDYRTALIFNPRLSALDLLRSINREFGISCEGSRSEIFHTLNQFLLEQNSLEHTVVLIVDEAQNLRTTALEEIRLLSNLETASDKLIQIVLVGQPELRELLARPELRQLNQRIAVRYHLKPLDGDDTKRYIEHRMRVAGSIAMPFTKGAYRKIYRWSKGIPRRINLLCDRALLLAYTQETDTISASDVARAAQELRMALPKAPLMGWRAGITAAFLAVVTVAAAASAPYLESMFFDKAPVVTPPPPMSQQPSQPLQRDDSTIVTSDVSRLREALGALSSEESLRLALTGLERRWAAVQHRDSLDFSGLGKQQMLARFDLPMAHFRGDFEQLLRFNAPALIELTLPGLGQPRYLAVLALEGNRLRVDPGLLGRSWLNVDELEGLWCGQAQIPWVNHENIPYLSSLGERSDEVLQLQRQLKLCGLYGGVESGVYDQFTVEAVTKLQTSQGIAPDGRVGPQTLLVLYRATGIYPLPSLKVTEGDEL